MPRLFDNSALLPRSSAVVLLAIATTLGIAGSSWTASAQSPDPSSLAEALFVEARKLMAQKRYSEACPKLEESHRLDPGGGTLLNLAVCHEAQGRMATAWREYREALSMAHRDNRPDRARIASERIALLEPKLSRIRIEVPDSLAILPGFEVRLDGLALPKSAWGVDLPVDPGNHSVEAGAPGEVRWRQSMKLKPEGDRWTVSIPRTAGSSDSAAPSEPGVARQADKADRGSRQSRSKLLKTTGLAIGGVGVAALGAGVYFGVKAVKRHNQSDGLCDASGCSQLGADYYDQSRRFARIADLGFGVGVVAVASGAFLLYLGRSGKPTKAAGSGTTGVAPAIGSSFGGVTAFGSW